MVVIREELVVDTSTTLGKDNLKRSLTVQQPLSRRRWSVMGAGRRVTSDLNVQTRMRLDGCEREKLLGVQTDYNVLPQRGQMPAASATKQSKL